MQFTQAVFNVSFFFGSKVNVDSEIKKLTLVSAYSLNDGTRLYFIPEPET